MAKTKPNAQPINRHAPQQSVGVIHQSVEHKTIFDPDVIERYSRLIPDAPNRILTVFELNSEAERSLQLDVLKHQANDSRRRDWMAFGIIVLGLALTGFLAWIKAPTYLSGGALVAIVGYVVAGFLKSK